jgi:hypothetical protein
VTPWDLLRDQFSAGDPCVIKYRGSWAAATVQSIARDSAVVVVQARPPTTVRVYDHRNIRTNPTKRAPQP